MSQKAAWPLPGAGPRASGEAGRSDKQTNCQKEKPSPREGPWSRFLQEVPALCRGLPPAWGAAADPAQASPCLEGIQPWGPDGHHSLPNPDLGSGQSSQDTQELCPLPCWSFPALGYSYLASPAPLLQGGGAFIDPQDWGRGG